MSSRRVVALACWRAHGFKGRGLACAVAAACLLAVVAPAAAQRAEPAPRELAEVGVTEHYDAQALLELKFVDSDGGELSLGEVFDGTRPTILTLNYSDCPMLCSLQLNGLVDAIKKMEWTAGQEYQIVTVSIDPTETPERARATKQKYLREYGRTGTASGWRFLTSRKEADIRRLADTVGFGYKYLPDTRQYAHAAVLIICTPDGRVSRYIGGVDYDPQTLRFALLEAAEGKVGSAWDRVLLFCFHYDETSGRYAPAARRLMQLGGAATVVAVGATLGAYWMREWRRAARGAVEAG